MQVNSNVSSYQGVFQEHIQYVGPKGRKYGIPHVMLPPETQ